MTQAAATATQFKFGNDYPAFVRKALDTYVACRQMGPVRDNDLEGALFHAQTLHDYTRETGNPAEMLDAVQERNGEVRALMMMMIRGGLISSLSLGQAGLLITVLELQGKDYEADMTDTAFFKQYSDPQDLVDAFRNAVSAGQETLPGLGERTNLSRKTYHGAPTVELRLGLTYQRRTLPPAYNITTPILPMGPG